MKRTNNKGPTGPKTKLRTRQHGTRDGIIPRDDLIYNDSENENRNTVHHDNHFELFDNNLYSGEVEIQQDKGSAIQRRRVIQTSRDDYYNFESIYPRATQRIDKLKF